MIKRNKFSPVQQMFSVKQVLLKKRAIIFPLLEFTLNNWYQQLNFVYFVCAKIIGIVP